MNIKMVRLKWNEVCFPCYRSIHTAAYIEKHAKWKSASFLLMSIVCYVMYVISANSESR